MGKAQTNKKRALIALVILALLVSMAAIVWFIDQSVSLRPKALDPYSTYYFESQTIDANAGDEVWLKMWIDTCPDETLDCTTVNAASVTLNFDPTTLQVVDSQGNPASSVVKGDYLTGEMAFPGWAENTVDNNTGQIKVSAFAANFDTAELTPFSGKGVMISVRFRVLNLASATTVNFETATSHIYSADAFNDDILYLGDTADPVAVTFQNPNVVIGSPAVTGTPPEASLSLRNKTTSAIEEGDEFEIEVLVTSSVETVATDVVLNYPTNILEVVDSNPSDTPVQISLGSIYPDYEYSYNGGINTSSGTIDVGGYDVTGTPAFSNAIFATVRFRALSEGSAPITFTFESGQKDDSNVLQYLPGTGLNESNDMLGQVSGLTVTINALPTVTPTPSPTPTPGGGGSGDPTPTPTDVPGSCDIRGDLNDNCCVNGEDVSILVSHWGWVTDDPLGQSYDLDSNGKINGADISIMVSSWGGTCVNN